jgi:cytidyltransferase-like protein
MSYENGYGPYRAGGIIRGWQAMGCRVVCASGYFDPVHKGHVRYLSAAKKLGDRLVVIVNNGYQTILKKGRPFMLEFDRLEVVSALGCVDLAVLAEDTDRSVGHTLSLLRPDIFANGGDVQTMNDCREAEVCRRHNIQMVFGVGGTEKVASSSDLIRRAARA